MTFQLTLTELRAACRELALPEGVIPQWRKREGELRQAILSGDPANLLDWPWTHHTMFPGPMAEERLLLKSCSDWEARWRPIVASCDQRERNVVERHCSLLAWLESSTGIPLSEYNLVLEFGGGYGSMRKVFHCATRRSADYIMYDLPLVAALQQYWLGQQGLPPFAQFTDAQGLAQFLSGKDCINGLFIATWSLSESPLEGREVFWELAAGFRAHLITYAQAYDIDNEAYFGENWCSPGFRWTRRRFARAVWLAGIRK